MQINNTWSQASTMAISISDAKAASLYGPEVTKRGWDHGEYFLRHRGRESKGMTLKLQTGLETPRKRRPEKKGDCGGGARRGYELRWTCESRHPETETNRDRGHNRFDVVVEVLPQDRSRWRWRCSLRRVATRGDDGKAASRAPVSHIQTTVATETEPGLCQNWPYHLHYLI